MPDLLTGFALIATVLTLGALVAGIVERAPLSFPMIFLGLGFVLGRQGVLSIDVHNPALEAVATVTLALVLFLDAVKLRFDEGRRTWIVPALVLGPGTFLTIGLIALAAMLLLGATPLYALLLGAILASTDPVVLRDVIRDTRIPRPIRRTLSVEAGTNDVVVLPIVLILIAVLGARSGDAPSWIDLGARLLVIGPVVGFAINGLGSWLIGWVDRLYPIREEYQALYGVGLVLASYAAGQAVGGDGFLAAFAAGVAVVVLNNELCSCFLEFGETASEMAMLLAFILFGAVLSTLIGTLPLGPTLGLAAFVLFVARPVALALVLRRASLSRPARAFLAWFGPRGLSSLLLALLAVLHHLPSAEQLVATVGVVVIVSVVLHGVSATPLAAWYGRTAAATTLPEERTSTPSGLFERDELGEVPRVTPRELAAMAARPTPPIVLDVRTRSQHERDDDAIPGGVRVLPDRVDEWAADQTERRPVVAYCT